MSEVTPIARMSEDVPNQIGNLFHGVTRITLEAGNTARAAIRSAMNLAATGQAMGDNRDSGIMHRWVCVGRGLAQEKRLSLGVTETFFHVATGFEKSKAAVVFIGTSADVMLSRNVFGILTFTAQLAMYGVEDEEKLKNHVLTPDEEATYFKAFFQGLTAQLREHQARAVAQDPKLADLLLEQFYARKTYKKKLFGPVRNGKVQPKPFKQVEAFWSKGLSDGEKYQLWAPDFSEAVAGATK